MLDVYANFVENWMAVPVIKGVKTANERFAGADDTYCIEALMQDGKALQAGTSHFLGQNFAKAFDVKFATKEGKLDHVWATSWGVSTRLMGALIMSHSDDKGLVIPPKLAPTQVVIVPIYKSEEALQKMSATAREIKVKLEAKNISVKYDDRDTQRPGWKFADYELKGIPVRIALGERDLANGTIEIARRDTLSKETIALDQVDTYVEKLLQDIQQNLFEKALARRSQMTNTANSFEEFKKILDEKSGFVLAHWDGTPETEEKIKTETKATIRCVPLNNPAEDGVCIYSGKPSKQRVLFARAY
jgi:prolyl-tRNA synthetase